MHTLHLILCALFHAHKWSKPDDKGWQTCDHCGRVRHTIHKWIKRFNATKPREYNPTEKYTASITDECTECGMLRTIESDSWGDGVSCSYSHPDN